MVRGRHFALSAEDEKHLLDCPDEERPDFISNDIEERYDEGWYCDTDTAWDAIHRALTDGTLSYDSVGPLAGAILGGTPLHSGSDYVISLKYAKDVPLIASALNGLTESKFRDLYFKIDPSEYGSPLTEEDFSYTWDWFSDLPGFFDKAAKAGRSVIFTVAQ